MFDNFGNNSPGISEFEKYIDLEKSEHEQNNFPSKTTQNFSTNSSSIPSIESYLSIYGLPSLSPFYSLLPNDELKQEFIAYLTEIIYQWEKIISKKNQIAEQYRNIFNSKSSLEEKLENAKKSIRSLEKEKEKTINELKKVEKLLDEKTKELQMLKIRTNNNDQTIQNYKKDYENIKKTFQKNGSINEPKLDISYTLNRDNKKQISQDTLLNNNFINNNKLIDKINSLMKDKINNIESENKELKKFFNDFIENISVYEKIIQNSYNYLCEALNVKKSKTYEQSNPCNINVNNSLESIKLLNNKMELLIMKTREFEKIIEKNKEALSQIRVDLTQEMNNKFNINKQHYLDNMIYIYLYQENIILNYQNIIDSLISSKKQENIFNNENNEGNDLNLEDCLQCIEENKMIENKMSENKIQIVNPKVIQNEQFNELLKSNIVNINGKFNYDELSQEINEINDKLLTYKQYIANTCYCSNIENPTDKMDTTDLNDNNINTCQNNDQTDVQMVKTNP